MLVAEERADTLLALDEALRELAGLDERLSRVVECRFFGGLTEEETAEVLGVTARTVRRDWTKAKGWLHQALR
jgi:RNA polymerase sigma factor (sigma-70 family)